jgi:hypothetical protein
VTTFRVLLVCVALLAGLAPHRVREVNAQGPDVRGGYVLDAPAGDDVLRAIDDVVEDMGGLRRPLARLRLRELNQPPQRIDVASTESEVSITTDGKDVIRTPVDGKPVQWTRADGEQFTIRTTWDGRTLKRIFTAEDGERANTYDFSPDGATLTMSVTLTSPQLPKPLTYTLVYRRASP